MKTKQFILMLILAFSIGTSVFAADTFIPKIDVFIQPKNGEKFNVNTFKSLKVGEEYMLQIVTYVKTTDLLFYKKEIDSTVVFYEPSIDIHQYSSSIRNLECVPIYDFIKADFYAPVLKTTPKDDATDHYMLSFHFSPRMLGEQEIAIIFHDITDSKYKRYSFSLHFED